MMGVYAFISDGASDMNLKQATTVKKYLGFKEK